MSDDKQPSQIISDVLGLDHSNLQPLNQEPEKRLPAEIIIQNSSSCSDEKKIETDADYARGNIYDIINKGFSSLDELIVVAEQTQQPRAYEIISTMLKTLLDANKDLMTIHKEKQGLTKKEEDSKPTTGPTNNIDKAVFIGSTSDLAGFLNKNK